jgi:hypothetical protein
MIAALVQKMVGVNRELEGVQRQLSALAEAEASGAEKLSKLNEDLRAAIESDAATDAIEGEILAADADLRRLAAKRAMAEKVIGEKARALAAKRKGIRIAQLKAAREKARQDLASADEEYVERAIVLSEAIGRREKIVGDIYVITERLQRLEVVLPQENFELQRLVPALLEKDPAARRERFTPGESAYRWATIEIPVTAPDRHTLAVEEDDEIAHEGAA